MPRLLPHSAQYMLPPGFFLPHSIQNMGAGVPETDVGVTFFPLRLLIQPHMKSKATTMIAKTRYNKFSSGRIILEDEVLSVATDVEASGLVV